MANLLTSYLLAAIDWDEYKRYGRELPPSTVDWIKQNGKPNIEFEFLVLQKAIKRAYQSYTESTCVRTKANADDERQRNALE